MESVKRAVYREQLSTLRVLDEIVELEKTKNYMKVKPSLYAYLTEELRYSEGAAMRRLHGARVIANFPEARELLRCRKVSLCTLSLIAKELLSGDRSLLTDIQGKSKREVEALLAFSKSSKGKAPLKEQVRVIAPPPPRKTKSDTSPLRFTATATRKTHETSPPPPPAFAEASADRPPEPMYRMTFTISKEVKDTMEEVRAGMSHKLQGVEDPTARIFEAGLALLKADIRKKRTTQSKDASKATATTSDSRYVSASLKRAIFERDQCKCQYQYEDGTKCHSTWQLEVDHIKPHALGGKTELRNLRLTCRSHNQYLAKEAGLIKASTGERAFGLRKN